MVEVLYCTIDWFCDHKESFMMGETKQTKKIKPSVDILRYVLRMDKNWKHSTVISNVQYTCQIPNNSYSLCIVY